MSATVIILDELNSVRDSSDEQFEEMEEGKYNG